MKEIPTLYCSLDIETSGFDPLKNEVLEIGFVFFEVAKNGFKIMGDYSRVFKPSGEVPANILGLTGISQEELDSADPFSEHKDELQNKLSTAVIVGHNISFDTKFLESCGLKFSGQIIDTLDLVQWILPTHHSYNLENLMHTFGISHKDAHRALADSKATLKLLERLLEVYCSFPVKLRKEIQKLIKPYNFTWQSFLEIPFEASPFTDAPKSKVLKKKPSSKVLSKLEEGTFYNFSLGEDYFPILAKAPYKKRTLLVVPKVQSVLDLYKQGLADAAIFLPLQRFSEENFIKLQKKEDLTSDEVKFILKIFVWRQTNWQQETFLDLNLSFFGGQFRNLISGGDIVENERNSTVVCDLETFLYLSENKLYSGRDVVMCGLQEFENCVTSNIGTKTSWGYINYLLKGFYNPELQSGNLKLKNEVEQALLGSDLFFGLVNALLQSDPPGFVYYKITGQSSLEEKYQKVKSSAESFIQKLLEANKALKSAEVEKFIKSLESFFEQEGNRVKWVELSENRCSFMSMPLDITELVGGILNNFSSVILADVLGPEALPKFFLRRLGLSAYKIKNIILPKEQKDKQGDLFSRIKSLTIKAGKINYHCLPNASSPEEVLKILEKDSSFPAAVLFGSGLQVRQFYEQNYKQLKQRVSVLAQSSSGGSNKIFRNFSINPKSVALVTDKFILKALTSQSAVERVSRLNVKTLVICRLPFEQFTHPYQEAVSAVLSNPFEEYALPRALNNFHSLIKFFYGPELKDVYIIDAKLGKPYSKVFKDYYNCIPGAEVSS